MDNFKVDITTWPCGANKENSQIKTKLANYCKDQLNKTSEWLTKLMKSELDESDKISFNEGMLYAFDCVLEEILLKE